MNLQNKTIQNKEILIDNSSIFNTIGTDVILKNCTVRCFVPANSLGIRGTLIDTTIIIEKKFTNFSWLEANLEACKFIGTLDNNQFGTKQKGVGSAKGCDFSEAKIDDCLFFGEDSSSHIFPLWPNFTILNPKENLADLHKVMDKDEIIEDIVDSIEFFDKELGAITFDAKQLAKELGVKTDEIKKSIASFHFIKYESCEGSNL